MVILDLDGAHVLAERLIARQAARILSFDHDEQAAVVLSRDGAITQSLVVPMADLAALFNVVTKIPRRLHGPMISIAQHTLLIERCYLSGTDDQLRAVAITGRGRAAPMAVSIHTGTIIGGEFELIEGLPDLNEVVVSVDDIGELILLARDAALAAAKVSRPYWIPPRAC